MVYSWSLHRLEFWFSIRFSCFHAKPKLYLFIKSRFGTLLKTSKSNEKTTNYFVRSYQQRCAEKMTVDTNSGKNHSQSVYYFIPRDITYKQIFFYGIYVNDRFYCNCVLSSFSFYLFFALLSIFTQSVPIHYFIYFISYSTIYLFCFANLLL